jgi:hypothetical protein
VAGQAIHSWLAALRYNRGMDAKVVIVSVAIAGAPVVESTAAAAVDHCTHHEASLCQPGAREDLHAPTYDPELAIQSRPTSEARPAAFFLNAEPAFYSMTMGNVGSTVGSATASQRQ